MNKEKAKAKNKTEFYFSIFILAIKKQYELEQRKPVPSELKIILDFANISSETELQRILHWYVNRPIQEQLQIEEEKAKLIIENKNKITAENKSKMHYIFFLTTIAKKYHIIKGIGRKRKVADENLRELDQSEIIKLKNWKKLRSSPVRNKIIVLIPLIEHLLKENLSWRQISKYLQVKRHFRCDHSYVRKIYLEIKEKNIKF